MTIYETVRRNMRYYRKRQGITQEWLAELTGMSPVNIRDLETKEYKLGAHIGTVHKIAVALSVDIRRMFDPRDRDGVRVADDDDWDWIRNLPADRVRLLRSINEALDAAELRKVIDET